MRNKFVFFLILILVIDIFSFEEGFAENQISKLRIEIMVPENGDPILLE